MGSPSRSDGEVALRFGVGDKVSCKLYCEYTISGQIACKDAPEEEWQTGIIVAVKYKSPDGQIFPYLVELEETADLHCVSSDTNCQCRRLERAWWLAILDPPANPIKAQFDEPGPYMVVASTFAGSSADRSMAERLEGSDLFAPQTVDVVEVVMMPDRVRGRLNSGGWISLRTPDNAKVFAVPLLSAHARLWRKHNLKFFEDAWSLLGIFPKMDVAPEPLELPNGIGTEINADTADELGRTALSFALHRRWPRTVAALLERHADPNLEDMYGWRPLHHAVVAGCDECVRLLLAARADTSARDRNPGVMLDRNSRSLAGDGLHRTPLHYAAGLGRSELVLALLEHGSPLETRDADAKTPLHLAIEEEHNAVVDDLLRHGADVNSLLGGLTLLMRATYHGDLELVRRLIAHRASLDVVGKDNMTALHLAARSGRVGVAKLLIEAGCDKSIVAAGRSPAEVARKARRPDMIALFDCVVVS